MTFILSMLSIGLFILWFDAGKKHSFKEAVSFMLCFVFYRQLVPVLSLKTKRFVAFCLLSFSLASLPQIASADIFRWEWVNPADHSQGKQQSTTLVPAGAGLVAEPRLDASFKNLTQAFFWDANLRDADFGDANLTNADFTNAEIRGVCFSDTRGFTAAQLYSTASYQAGDLTGVSLAENNLTGWNFAEQNLTNTSFSYTTLTNADFTNADISGANFNATADFTMAQLYSTANYQTGDLTGVYLSTNLTGWNFVGQNLTDAFLQSATLINADLSGANLTDASFRAATLTNTDLSSANLTGAFFWDTTLTNANFTNAEIRGANFYSTMGFTTAQLYSTASYQAGDLTGVSFYSNDLTGWNFAGQNLTDVDFRAATLANADLSGTKITDTSFQAATLVNADFTNAEVRGAHFYNTIGFTATQLYSTASYQAGDLTGVSFYSNDLTGWNFVGQNLTDAAFYVATLSNVDLSGANLTDASFSYATLTNVDFTNAEVRGAKFTSTTDSGFTAAQLYSTASYQSGDLTGVRLSGNDLTGWNFAEQNLTDASFQGAMLTNADFRGANLTDIDFRAATLTNADFTNAEIRGAILELATDFGFTAAQLYSTASYQAGDLTGVFLHSTDLTGWNFARQNLTDAFFQTVTLTNADLSGANLTNVYLVSATLTNADLSGANLMDVIFYAATLTHADFTNAEIRGVDFGNTTGFTAAQLYSTANYQSGDLTGVNFRSNDLTGWNFVGQKLTNVSFRFATLTNANFSRADARSAQFVDLSSAITYNFIYPDGHVEGLDITAGDVMRLWDYDGDASFPILVEDVMSVDSTGTLRVVFEDDDWGSLITFKAGIGVSLDGTLELLVEPDEETDLASLVGTTFDLFDWANVSPIGTFSQIITSEGLVWDTSELYTTGAVTLVSVPEPSTALLFAMSGVIGLLTRRKPTAF